MQMNDNAYYSKDRDNVEVCSKIILELLKVMEQKNTISQKFVETRLFKKPESISSLITRQI